jgi:hypothetical protein
MRIALCYSAHLRGFKEPYKTTYEHIYKPLLQLGQIDTFVHTWSQVGPKYSWHTYGHGSGGLDLLDINEKEMVDVLKPVSYVVEKYEDKMEMLKLINFTDQIPGHAAFVSPDGICSSTVTFYKIYACDLLRREHEIRNNFKYDIVVRLRPDFHYGLLPLERMDLQNYIYVPHYHCGEGNGNQAYPNCLASDQFAISNNSIMTTYGSCFLYLKELYKTAKEFWSADEIVSNYLRDCNIKIQAIANGWCWK